MKNSINTRSSKSKITPPYDSSVSIKNLLRITVPQNGFVLPMVIAVMAILVALAIGEMMTSYHSRIRAIKTKAETEAMLTAEAGYERAIFWMSKQPDILGALQNTAGRTGTISFGTSSCNYEVSFLNFIGAKPVFKVHVFGASGAFSRIVDVDVIQEATGWAMGVCQIPTGANSTSDVYFADGEIIDIPIHINDLKDSPDNIDIHITGHPVFKCKVEMGESRKTSGGTDKYSSVMNYFQGGIDFDQPYIRITDSTAVTSKLNRFRDSTKAAYKFTPVAATSLTGGITPMPAVQLEFFVQNGVGKVRISNNCNVRGFQQNTDNKTNNFMITPGSNPQTYQRYNIYAYHFSKDPNTVVDITDTYVTQTFGGYTSAPGGQIYVNGNVIIGSGDDVNIPDQNMVVKGKITVVATGNIWIGDNVVVDDAGGTQRDANGMPTADISSPNYNPNVLGLIAKGVIKVVDPGISNYGVNDTTGSSSPNYYPRDANFFAVSTKIGGTVDTTKRHYYQPIGIRNAANPTIDRKLPHSTVVEAAITVGGGGWGAENVARSSYGDRREYNSGTMDNLIVHGSITEVVRGVVGLPPSDGYNKNYYIDNRLMSGILPADIWFTGKYIPSPAGWSDHSVGN